MIPLMLTPTQAYALTIAVAIVAAGEWLWIFRQLRRIRRVKQMILVVMEG